MPRSAGSVLLTSAFLSPETASRACIMTSVYCAAFAMDFVNFLEEGAQQLLVTLVQIDQADLHR